MRGRLRFATHLEATKGSQGMWARGFHLFNLPRSCYNSPVPPTKEHVHLSGALIFATVAQGTPLD